MINPGFETFAEHFGIEGLVGVRAITHYAGRFFSPVYGYCEWKRGVQAANCAIVMESSSKEATALVPGTAGRSQAAAISDREIEWRGM